jgi:tRNA (cmo5U34)-methyltransferase
MADAQFSLNSSSQYPEDYDTGVAKVIPLYLSIHQEVINLVKALSITPHTWMDTGCGTGSLVEKACIEFPKTRFLLVDPSDNMLHKARKKLSSSTTGKIKIMNTSPTQDISGFEEKLDIVTAIQCHHYLCDADRTKATKVCYDLLKEGGVYITSENIRPFTEEGITIGKQHLANFQLSMGKTQEEVDKYLDRFDKEYFPITVEEHLRLLRETGFRTVEILWYSYMQAVFYCIK